MKTISIKKYIAVACMVLVANGLFSQSSNQNYIKTITPISAVTTETALNNLSSSLKVENISYFDGLGRTIQTVSKKASPTSKDVVQNIVYDQYGRVTREYLPYVDNTTDGSYKTNATANQASFYNTTFFVAHTTTPFSDAVFDGSPLNKVVETSAPDTDWQLGNSHTTKISEGANAANEVRLFVLSGGDCIGSTFYAANQLGKVKVTDPNGNYSYTYTDKLGNTILTKSYITTKKGVDQFATTYYVYDDFGNIVYVISPKAYELMETALNYSVNALTQDLVFQYKYDERQRLVEKKTPGAGWQYIVYNKLNQPVLIQDANLRLQNKWSFVKYDVLGREIMTGLFDASSLPLYQTRSSAQTQLNANQADIGESETLQDANNPYGYTNFTLPNQNLDILTVNYYDDYDFDNNGSTDYSFIAGDMPCITFGYTVCTPFAHTSSNQTRGMLTGIKTKILDAANPVQWVTTASFYDDEGQLAQTQCNDHLGGNYRMDLRYDFSGNMVHSVLRYTEVSSNVIQIINYYTYDKVGRLTRVDQKNNNDDPVVLSKEKYNELSQLIDKSLHSTNNASTFAQSIDYRYHIQGWLKSINNEDLSNDAGFTDPETGLPPVDGLNDDASDLWGMQLYYNTVASGVNTVKQYTGNVSEKHWKSASDNVKRAYGYAYDKLDRLTAATYTEYNSTSMLWGQNVNRYNENNITYDVNGNLLTMKRTGYQTTGSFGEIDNLSYNYTGNISTAINDASAVQGTNDFKDNGSSGSNEYTYDANGNMISNTNKQITSITYNYMNLPTAINFSSGNKIEYFYDATGIRIRKKLTQGTTITNKKYTGLFEYTESGGITTLEAFYTAEGRCVPSGVSSPAYRYEYNYSDNTGSVVLSFSDLDANGTINPSTEILQQSHYYPFGMRMQGIATPQIGPENKYKFGSKELQDEFGLNEYDFGARFYDPATGRWGCVDPMADMAPNWTPFRYGFNNPVTITDPTGMFEDGWVIQDGTAQFDPDDNIKDQQSVEAKYGKGATYAKTIVGQDQNGNILQGDENGNVTVWIPEVTISEHQYEDAFADAMFGEGFTQTMHDNAGDNNAYMFSSEEIDQAVDVEVEILMAVVPVGEVFQAIKWGGRGLWALSKLDKVKSLINMEKIMCKVLSRGCFVEGTKVWTEQGMKNIEDIKVGDLVYAYNIETGTVNLKKVLTTYVREVDKLVKIEFENETIYTTLEHPFFINNSWVEAGKLKAGDQLFLGSKLNLPILKISTIDTVVKVFNCTVEDDHNYYVTDKKVLVHNTCGENVVYHSVEKGVTKYVGITNDFIRRAGEHLAKKGITIEPLMNGLSRGDARAVEQALIDFHGMEKNAGGTLMNLINSISPNNPIYKGQLERGYELLKSINYL